MLEDMRTLEGIDTGLHSVPRPDNRKLEDMRTLEGIDTGLYSFITTVGVEIVRRYENP